MGIVILTNGQSKLIPEMDGHLHLDQIVQELPNDVYSVSYKLMLLNVLGKLGSAAASALPMLEKIEKTFSSDAKLGPAITQAFTKIKNTSTSVFSDTKSSHTVPSTIQSHTRFSPGSHSAASNYSDRAPLSPPVSPPSTHNYSVSPPTVVSKDKCKIQFRKTEHKDLSEGERVYQFCNFCGKIGENVERSYSNYLAGKNNYHCMFCLKNNFYSKKTHRHIFAYSLRYLVGYYYYSYSSGNKSLSTPVIYHTELESCLTASYNLGSHYNPAVVYDADQLNWYFDFRKVEKLGMDWFKMVLAKQMLPLNMYENAKDCKPHLYVGKIIDAAKLFMEKRERIDGKTVFIPTLEGCGTPPIKPGSKSVYHGDLMDFSFAVLTRKK